MILRGGRVVVAVAAGLPGWSFVFSAYAGS